MMASFADRTEQIYRIVRVATVVMLLLAVALTAMLVHEKRTDRAFFLQEEMEQILQGQVVEPPEKPQPSNRLSPDKLAKQVNDAGRLWGPLFPPPPPPPPKKENLAGLASGLSIVAITESGGAETYIVKEKGKTKIVGVGDAFGPFKIKGAGKGGLVLQYKDGRTHALPLPGR